MFWWWFCDFSGFAYILSVSIEMPFFKAEISFYTFTRCSSWKGGNFDVQGLFQIQFHFQYGFCYFLGVLSFVFVFVRFWGWWWLFGCFFLNIFSLDHFLTSLFCCRNVCCTAKIKTNLSLYLTNIHICNSYCRRC